MFVKWEEVEKLQTIEELREALTREIAEYREEVRGIAQMELDEGEEAEYEYEYEYEGEVDADMVTEPETIVQSPTRGRPSEVDTENIPDSPCERTGSPVRTKLSMAAAAGRSPTLSPRRKRQSSPYTPRTPRTPGPNGDESTAGQTPGGRRHTRRSSSQSMHRRSMSFLFGGGMKMSSLAMTAASGPAAVTTASSAEYTAGTVGGTAGSIAGRRSRAPSATIADLNSLRPLIRHLSTTNLSDLNPPLATDDEPLMTEGTPDEGPIIMSRRGSRARRPTLNGKQ